jgi:hypothetical protein
MQILEDFKFKWNSIDAEERVNILNKYLNSSEVVYKVNQYVKNYIEHSSFKDLYLNDSGEGVSKLKIIKDFTYENNGENFILNNRIIQLSSSLTITAKTEDTVFLAIKEEKTRENTVELELYFSCVFNPKTYEMNDFIINSHYNLKEIDEELQLMNYLNHL